MGDSSQVQSSGHVLILFVGLCSWRICVLQKPLASQSKESYWLFSLYECTIVPEVRTHSYHQCTCSDIHTGPLQFWTYLFFPYLQHFFLPLPLDLSRIRGWVQGRCAAMHFSLQGASCFPVNIGSGKFILACDDNIFGEWL